MGGKVFVSLALNDHICSNMGRAYIIVKGSMMAICSCHVPVFFYVTFTNHCSTMKAEDLTLFSRSFFTEEYSTIKLPVG